MSTNGDQTPSPTQKAVRRRRRGRGPQMTPEKAAACIARFDAGETISGIAKALGAARRTVADVVHRKGVWGNLERTSDGFQVLIHEARGEVRLNASAYIRNQGQILLATQQRLLRHIQDPKQRVSVMELNAVDGTSVDKIELLSGGATTRVDHMFEITTREQLARRLMHLMPDVVAQATDVTPPQEEPHGTPGA